MPAVKDHVSDASVSSPLAEPPAPAPTSNGDQSSVAAHAALPAAGNCVILSTAIVDIDDDAGRPIRCRALLDAGSQVNFVSRRFLGTLKLRPRLTNVSISGINDTVSSVNHAVQLRLRSRFNTFTATIDCLVADRVTENLPAMTLQLKQIEIPHHIKLADPQFYVSSGIDLLIGADIFWQLLCVGQIKPSEKHPTLQKTQLGWVVGGRHCSSPEITRGKCAQSFHAAITNRELHHGLQRFWNFEDVCPPSVSRPLHEETCEKHFLENVTRAPDGRFIVKLPCKEDVLSALGDSKITAQRRFKALEARLDREPEVKAQYTHFMSEYRALGHMRLERSNLPVGSLHVARDFYVDDILTGADSLQQARLIREQVISVLKRGSFTLSKWLSNSPKLLDSDQDTNTQTVDFNKDLESRILGIRWNPTSDCFHFLIKEERPVNSVTKRTILSDIARIFDPLGFVGPSVIISKLIIQELWQLNLKWDESVPMHLHTRWSMFRRQLATFNELKIPRCVKFGSEPHEIRLHGFCDASQNAYGACVYIRSRVARDTFRVKLLYSKSRVSPLKAISFPRLELCATVLLAQLVDKVRRAIQTSGMREFLWSDSTIALNWIASSSRGWTVFVANRVGEIQRLTDIASWRHVPSKENPADLLSRGVQPSDLPDCRAWWHGPQHLSNDLFWPSADATLPLSDMPEVRTRTTAAAVSPELTDVHVNRLVRWQRVEQIRQHFWKRWSVEYLSQLQERHKWRKSKGEQLRTGQLVLIKQQGLASLQWLLGRIEEVHLGADGMARSAKVKTTKTSVVRPLSRLAILPIEM
ncbi:hypothetical protein KM043_013369 [Ampulex compressa]|nr:hypothetical protein KM043_013369 [Ampulex compressa]